MPAAARPYWTGFLKLSPVTISVRLYAAATEKERIHFHMIHESSGERVRTQTVVPGLGTAERAEIVKGFEYEKGRYVTIAPQDLEKLRFETTDTIDTTEFVEADGLDPVYVADPYYLVPDGSLAEAGYRVIGEALRRTDKVAIGRVVINQREREIAIRPRQWPARQRAAFRGPGPRRRVVFCRDRRGAGRPRRAGGHGADHRPPDLSIRPRKIRRPLSGGAAGGHRAEARRQAARTAAGAQTCAGHQSDGRAEAQPRRGRRRIRPYHPA